MIYKNGERMRDFLGLFVFIVVTFLYFGNVFNKTIIPKDDFQSVLRTLESLFWFLVLLHVKYHKM